MKPLPFNRWLAGGAAVVAAALGVLTLVAWALGRRGLSSVDTSYISMAPITASLFVALGLAALGRTGWPGARFGRPATTVSASLAALAGFLELARLVRKFPLPWDTWGFPSEVQFGDLGIGQMSPVTAICFILAAMALLARENGLDRWAPSRWIDAISAALGLVVSAWVAVSYTLDTPLFYGGDTVPMALLTALGFTALHSSLLLSGPLPAQLGTLFTVDTSAPFVDEQRVFARRLILTLLAVGGLVVAAGFVYLRSEEAAGRLTANAELEAIAHLKSAQIESWRNERRSDARFLLRTPAVIHDVAALVARPDDPAARARLLGWLEPIKGEDRYESILVFDTRARLLLALPAGHGPTAAPPPELFPSTLAGSEVVFTDLQASTTAAEIHLDLLVPIRPTHSPDSEPATSGPPLAMIVLRLNPKNFLFPLIQNWPLPSATAETLLVRREGNEIVYLNELRHRTGTALQLRRSIHEVSLPGAIGARGVTEASDGRDYRGVAVLSSVRLLADSPWILVAKIDQAEIYAPIQREARLTGAMVLALLLAVGLAGNAAWRQRNAHIMRRAFVAEKARRALGERLTLLTRHANDIILLFDEDQRILEANDRALAAYGRTLEEMRRLKASDLRSPAAAALAQRDFSAALHATGIVFETIHRHRDGSEFPVEVSTRSILTDGRQQVLSIVRDITQRKAHEEEIERLNRMFFVISQVNQAMVRAQNRDELFAEICRVLVDVGRFRIAWIGWLNSANRLIEPVASAGDTHGYVAGLRIPTDPAQPEGRGPSGTAFREGRISICNDFFADPATAPWRERAAQSGFQSSIALPLRCEGTVVGLLTVYAAERNFFQPRKIELLDETAGDISFALGIFARDERRLAAEAAVRASESRLQFLITATPAIIYSLQAGGDFRTTFLSPNVREILGYEAADIIADPQFWLDHLHPDDAAQAVGSLAELELKPTSTREYRFRHADGSWRWMHDETRVVRAADGHPRELVGYWFDITARKQAEADLAAREEIFSSIVSQALDAIALVDVATGAFLEFNRSAHEGLGYTREEFAKLAIVDIQAEHSVEKIGMNIRRILDQGGASFETRHLHRDGRLCDVRVSARRLHLRGRDCITALWSDITESKRLERALRQSEERFRNMFEEAPLGVALVDSLTGRILEVNTQYEVIAGRTKSELTTIDWMRLTHPDDVQADLDQMALMNAGKTPGFRMDKRYLRTDGSYVWIHLTIAPIAVEDRTHPRHLAMIQDITDAKKAETALQQLAADLRTRNETLSRFNHVAVGRELRMIELKREVNELCARLGEAPRHRLPTQTVGSSSPLPPQA